MVERWIKELEQNLRAEVIVLRTATEPTPFNRLYQCLEGEGIEATRGIEVIWRLCIDGQMALGPNGSQAIGGNNPRQLFLILPEEF